MPRPHRLTIPGATHHIVHRGNNKRTVFFETDDFTLYLKLLNYYSQKHAFKVLSYCLMSNHVHIVGVPEDKKSIENLVRDTHSRYSFFLNRKMGRSGHNWQDRHNCCPCDEFHGIAAMCYSEMNPVRAGMVKNAWNYRWSSARIHTGFERAENTVDMSWWNMNFSCDEWKELLIQRSDIDLIENIRKNTITGKTLGVRN